MHNQHLNTRSALVRWAYTRLAGYEVVRSKWVPREAAFGLIRYSTEWQLAKRNDGKHR